MKKYTVDLIKRVTLENIEAESAKEAKAMAILLVEEHKSEFEVQEMIDEDTQDIVMICEICEMDILTSDDYTTDQENGGYFCTGCSKC